MSVQAKRVTPRRSKSSEIKATHKVVLQALEIANLALKRVVTVEEIRKALKQEDIDELQAVYVKDIGHSVSVILGLLITRGIVFSPGKLGKKRYYGSNTVLNSSTSLLPDKRSRRRRVLDLVRGAVTELNRAVRIKDVLDYAAGKAEASDITPELITRDILGLVPTKDLLLIGNVRGDNGGSNLYLPSDLKPELYMPKEPLTWLELVARVFDEAWLEHKKIAEESECRIKPITTRGSLINTSSC